MAGARALWRATGMTDADFGKPIVAIANSFTQFVPGHVHLRNLGALVADAVAEAGGVGREFNTIAVDDGIAMGHGGMLYSLPSRELIADAVEYMVQAHCADALVCISNCDKITPGMLLAALRLNIPTVFVSGGPMEAGKTVAIEGVVHAKLDLIDAMIASANEAVTDEQLGVIERSACPTCGSCSGMFTANSMNCLTEAIGLALPGNGSTLATHAARRELFDEAGRLVVDLARRYYDDGRRLGAAPGDRHPGGVRERGRPRRRHGRLDQHRAAPAGRRPRGRGRLRRGRHRRHLAPGARACPRSRRTRRKYHMEDVHRAGGIPAILGELDRGGLLRRDVHAVHAAVAGRRGWPTGTSARRPRPRGRGAVPRRAGRGPYHRAVLHRQPVVHSGHRRGRRLHPRRRARLHRRRWAGHPARQPRPGGLRGEDRRRARRQPDLPRPGPGLRVAGGQRSTRSCAATS